MRLPATVSCVRTCLSRQSKQSARTFSTLNEEGIQIQSNGSTQTVVLNRPKALNALNLPMVHQLTPLYLGWQKTDDVAIIMKGNGGKAFCAGGDVVQVRKSSVEEKKPLEEVCSFFRDEYKLNHLIATSTTPQISLLNGITMGGGVGLSVHGRYRVATDNTMFAMPETAIGLFPDVGGSHFLPKLPGSMGMYLALTGDRLKGADVYKAGVATHFVSADKMEQLHTTLSEVKSSDEIEGVLEHYCTTDTPEANFGPHLDSINDCFSRDSVQEILQSLSEHGSDWAQKHVKTMKRVSPFSLLVTHRMLRESINKNMDITDCLRMEYRIVNRFMSDGEFFEGVRALLIDKDQSPKWQHTSLEDVPDDRVNKCFAPLDVATEGPEWEPIQV